MAKTTNATTAVYVAQPTQTPYDITLMCYGTLDQLSALIQDNNLSQGLSSTNYAGQQMTYTLSNVATPTVSGQNTAFNIVYATAYYIPPDNGAPTSFLLQEAGFFILQESSSKIIIT